MQRTILHVDMDAFFAAVEQHDHPEYAGKPVVIGAPRNKRGVVSAASYEARVFGIHSAMPSREAAHLCPDAVFLPVNMARYKEVSDQVFTIFERFTPYIEPLSIDEAFLDVSGARRLLGTGPEIAARIRTTIKEETGLTASVGVAVNKFLAKLASDLEKPDGLTVVPIDVDQIKAFLAPLNISRIWGVGKVMRSTLERHGYSTIGQLQDAPMDRLIEIVGENGAEHLAAMAVGDDSRELEMDRERKSYSREHTFARDCSDAERLQRVLHGLVEDVGGQLRADKVYGQTAHIKLRWQGFETITRQKQCPSPICDDTSLREIALELFSEQELIKPVRLIGFGVSGIIHDRPAQQLGLFDTKAQSRARREKISRTMDEIKNKFGDDSITTASGIDSTQRPSEKG